jgi:hypothetical protein
MDIHLVIYCRKKRREDGKKTESWSYEWMGEKVTGNGWDTYVFDFICPIQWGFDAIIIAFPVGSHVDREVLNFQLEKVTSMSQ